MGDQPLTKLYVEQVFKGLGKPGKGEEFLSYVASNVHWTVKGTHPLAGVCTSMQAFKDGALARVRAGLQGPVVLVVRQILINGNWVVVELAAKDAIAKAGWCFDNEYCWVCRFSQGKIVEARAYLDSAIVARLISESGE